MGKSQTMNRISLPNLKSQQYQGSVGLNLACTIFDWSTNRDKLISRTEILQNYSAAIFSYTPLAAFTLTP